MAGRVCMVGGMCSRGHVWQRGMHGGGHAWQGACVAGGKHGRKGVHGGGHAWHARPPADTTRYGDCILV